MSLLQIKDPKTNKQPKQRFVVGIDFGTTNSLVCKYTNGDFKHYGLAGNDLISSSSVLSFSISAESFLNSCISK